MTDDQKLDRGECLVEASQVLAEVLHLLSARSIGDEDLTRAFELAKRARARLETARAIDKADQ